MYLYQNPDMYPPTFRQPLLAFSIHNPYTIVNPFTNGFNLEIDRSYTFRLKRVRLIFFRNALLFIIHMLIFRQRKPMKNVEYTNASTCKRCRYEVCPVL